MAKDIVRTLVRLPYRHDRPPRLGVVANTYGSLPGDVAALLVGVDLILHVGDIGEASVLTRLEAIAPVIGVAGDYDPRSRFPLHRVLEVCGKTIALTHGHRVRRFGNPLRAFLAEEQSEARDSRHLELLNFFPPVDCVVFAHPATACRLRFEHTLVFNPGAIAAPGGDHALAGPTLGVISLGRAVEGSIIQLGAPPPPSPQLAPVS